MITLPINDELRIATDTYSWTIQECRKRTRKGEEFEEWSTFKWFSTFEQAIKAVGDHLIRSAESEGFKEATEEVSRVARQLSALMPEGIEVICSCPSHHSVNSNHGPDCPLNKL